MGLKFLIFICGVGLALLIAFGMTIGTIFFDHYKASGEKQELHLGLGVYTVSFLSAIYLLGTLLGWMK